MKKKDGALIFHAGNGQLPTERDLSMENRLQMVLGGVATGIASSQTRSRKTSALFKRWESLAASRRFVVREPRRFGDLMGFFGNL
ncbi:hypothetical protein CEXT_776621 [Caerostris extrusa]|uniref:Uncharacterized protein n=1 Tax=Caerostris extrusa TaxID=172846 RepID=A0AAV4WH22_CAEEX|nr:hypothetical protein CEXT_776621 [Caerostris extrusa]